MIDIPTETFAATRDFWAAALLADAQQIEEYLEFTGLGDPAALWSYPEPRLAGDPGQVGALLVRP